MLQRQAGQVRPVTKLEILSAFGAKPGEVEVEVLQGCPGAICKLTDDIIPLTPKHVTKREALQGWPLSLAEFLHGCSCKTVVEKVQACQLRPASSRQVVA